MILTKRWQKILTAVPSSFSGDGRAGRAARAAPGNRSGLWTVSAWTATCMGRSSRLLPGRGATVVQKGNSKCQYKAWISHISGKILKSKQKTKQKQKNLCRKPVSGCVRTLKAVSKEPARMWSTGSWELLHHIWVGLMPLVGGTKKPSSAPPAPPAGMSWWLGEKHWTEKFQQTLKRPDV